MTTRRITIGITTACALVGLASASAFAEDGKSFPGILCQASGSAQDLSYSTTSVANRNATTSSAVCPIVRDVMGEPASSIEVELRDRHEVQNIQCTAYSVSTTGTAAWLQTLSTAGTGFQTLSFDAIEASDWGAYSLVCALPGMTDNVPSYLATYRISEP